MPTIAIMTGIQGSGKSTFCKECLASFTRINLDDLHTRYREKQVFENALQDYVNIVIDNTNPTVADRKKYIQRAKTEGYKVVGYFMQSRIKDCVERNRNRTGKARVPDMAIAATSNKLQLPSLEEGFDELYFVSIVEDGFTINEWRR